MKANYIEDPQTWASEFTFSVRSASAFFRNGYVWACE